ncbi:low temperature requirement protein A [Deinococcus sonorensis]|uniref:Low temperature requirement protein A n=2 Tax=Deinococcus sonorensis TaxID=309891 RepID=A0AAU7UBJ5_9DEIO
MTWGQQDVRPGQHRPEAASQRVSWLELFFDLLFVTAFDQLAQRYGKQLSLPGFGIFALMFVAVWWAWLGNTSFAARYGNVGRPYRWGTLLQIVATAMLALAIQGDLKDVGWLFAAAYAAGRVALILIYAWHGRQNGMPEGERRLVGGFVVSTLLWVLSAPLHGAAQWGLWIGALLLDLVVSLYVESRYQREQPHQEHYPERVGTLIIISLGSAITNLVISAGHQQLRFSDQLPMLLALVCTLALWRMYFDEANGLPARLAAQRGHRSTLLSWTYAHLPLTLALTVLAVGLGLDIRSGDRYSALQAQVVISSSLASVFLSLVLVRVLAAQPLRHEPGLVRTPLHFSLSSVARLVGAGLLLGLLALHLPALPYMLGVTGLTLAVAVASWRDPVRQNLTELEEQLDPGLPPG